MASAWGTSWGSAWGSAWGSISVGPTNGFYPAAFYGVAFDHLPTINTLTATDTVDVLAAVAVSYSTLNANDVISTSDVPTPAVVITRNALANDVKSASTVSTPAAVTIRNVLANDVKSNSSVGQPTAAIVRNVLANDVKSNSSVGQPVAVILRSVLANDVVSASSLTRPSLLRQQTFTATGVVSLSKVTTPSQLQQRQALLANDVISAPFLRLVAPATNGFYPAAFYGVAFDHLPITNVLVAAEAVDVLAAVTIGRFDVAANDVKSNSSVGQPTAAITRGCLANDVVSASKVTNPIVGIVGIIDARDLNSTSSVSRPAVQQTYSGLPAGSVLSSSSVSKPSQLKQLQILPASGIVSTPFVRLVAPATNGFYPTAFYGAAFDHLPITNVLSAVGAVDVLAAVTVTTFNLNANDVTSQSTVTSPSLTPRRDLFANDVVSASSVSRPSQLYEWQTLPTSDVISLSRVSTPLQLQRQTLLANDVISAPFLRLVAPATNGFYPTAFYGVAFDHLPAANVLAAVENADVLAVAAAALTEARSLVSASTVSRPALDSANYSFVSGVLSASSVSRPSQLKQLQTILVGGIVSAPSVRLVAPATNGFYPTAFYGVAFDHLPITNVLVAAEAADVLVVNTEVINALDLIATEAVDGDQASFDAVLLDKILLDFDLYEDPDVFAFKTGRWDFSYGEDEGIRVVWEEQKVVVVGRPRSPVKIVPVIHSLVIAFNPTGFDNLAFFIGADSEPQVLDYDDDEAIVVPSSYMIERLRENRTSYVVPRRKV